MSGYYFDLIFKNKRDSGAISDSESCQCHHYRLPVFEFETPSRDPSIFNGLPWFSYDSHEDDEYDHSPLHRNSEDYSDKDSDEDIVTWDGDDDPENPLNWKWKQKWTATILVSCFTFISPFSSTMVTPALDDIGQEFGITSSFTKALIMSIFLLGFAPGPFILAPLSEVFGRVSVLQYANLIYLVFNTACGFAKSTNQMLAFRVLSGIGGSAPQALCNGVLADTWRKEERGKGQAVYGLLTFIGPAVAPVIGAYVSQRVSWRWIFWSTSLFDVLVQVSALLFLPETYAPTILTRKAKKLRKQTGNMRLRSEYEGKSFWQSLRRAMIRPFVMLFMHPAVQAPSLFRAYLYGVMYLVLSTFHMVWEKTYNMSVEIASLNYLSLGIGFIIGLQISHPLMDKLYAYFQRYYNVTEGLPSWRAPPMLLGGIFTPIGLLIYGWTAQFETHWIVPNLGCVIFAMGLIIGFQCSQAFITDAYGTYAASASAAGAFLRTMCGFSFPLFAPSMYERMGLGAGNSLLAGVTFVLALAGPVCLWFYGEKLVRWSRYLPA